MRLEHDFDSLVALNVALNVHLNELVSIIQKSMQWFLETRDQNIRQNKQTKQNKRLKSSVEQ